ncbi:MAG: type II secretion system F family protein [Planctomycetaceae bacterium]|nr:MAG: type II secretion system F family protein [Planctomycetaceae bacterium]
MAVYGYIAGDNRGGALTRGTITADSPRQARDQLRSRGLSVQTVTEHRPSSVDGWYTRYMVRRQSSKVTGLLQEMATLLGAGIPLLEALDTITRQHSGRFRQCILMLREHVSAGGSLAEAMAIQPMLFDELCRNIIEVGESAGTLDAAMVRLVQFRLRSSGLKNRIASAMMYPCIVMVAGLAASIFLMTYVLPNLLGVLTETGKQLPTATVIIKTLAEFLRGWWWVLLLGLLSLGGLLTAVMRTAAGRMRWHRLQLRIPLLGELIRKQAIARMAMVMATLLRSDLVFIRAIQIAQRTVRNSVLRSALEACEQAVGAGYDIALALEKTKAFPPLVIQIFAVGQASGRLELMLENLATDYDTQVDISSARLTALLEPLMMILLAIMVGFIAFATILPILEAGDVL